MPVVAVMFLVKTERRKKEERKEGRQKDERKKEQESEEKKKNEHPSDSARASVVDPNRHESVERLV